MKTQPTLAEIADSIANAMPELDTTDRQIAAAIHRLMSTGGPVDPSAIAQAAGVPVDRVDAQLALWPGVYRDDDGRVVGFWGQATSKLDPEYRLVVDDKTTYAWCALDTLFIPPVIGKSVRVEASDPVTGQLVSMVVDADGAHDVTPKGAVMSVVVPDGPFGYDVIESFCHRVLFFASEESGSEWTAANPGTTIVSVDDAFEIGRALTREIAPEESQQ